MYKSNLKSTTILKTSFLTRNNLAENFLLFTLIGSLFLPSLPISDNFSIGFEDLIILPFFPLLILLMKVKLKKNRLVTIYSILLLSMILSTVIGYLFLNVPTYQGDINTIIKNLKYLFVIIVVQYCSVDSLSNKIISLLKFGSYLIILIGFIQYFDFLGLGTYLNRFFATESRLTKLFFIRTNRVVLTTPNPNTAAALSIYFLSFNIVLFLENKKYVYIVNTILLFIILLFTSSRTGFIGFGMGTVTYLLFNNRINRTFKLGLVLLFIFVGIILIPRFEYLYYGIARALEGTNTSLLVRFTKWGEALILFTKSPIFGWGPAEALYSTPVDGEIFLFLRNYGILGTILLFLTIYFTPINYLNNRNVIKYNKSIRTINSIVVIYSVVAAFLMLTLNFYSGYKLFLPYWVMCSIIVKEISEQKRSYG